MIEKLLHLLCGSVLEYMIAEEGVIVLVTEEVFVSAKKKESISLKAGIGSVESGTAALVGDAD